MNGLLRKDDTAGTKKMPSVAIVILNWNGKEYLQQFLPSVSASTYVNKMVVLADNASTDDSVKFVKENYPAVKILQNNTNYGFAKGYNVALQQVQADYYVLLNNDVEVMPNWIEPIINLMQADTAIGACQPKILSYKNKTQFEYAGASGGWIDKLGYPFARGRLFDFCEKDEGQYDTVQQCFWASGAALFVRANLYHQLGGLDEYFFAHQEEIDFCWRLQLAGYKIYVQPASIVYHVGGGTLAQGQNKKNYLNFRNSLIMLAKNLGWGHAIIIIFLRLTLDGVFAFKSLFSGKVGSFLAILKAHLQFYKWLFLKKKSATIFKNNKVELSGYYRGLVVWQYFVKKKKKFLEIVGKK